MWLSLTIFSKEKDNIFMRFFLYLLFIVAVLSCYCIEPASRPPPPPQKFPDKELEQMILEGTYYFEDSREEKARKRAGLADCPPVEEEILGTYRDPCYHKRFEFKIREEGLRFSIEEYCYKKTDEEEKEPVFDKNLRIRLYDKGGRKLAEDYLRLWCDKPNDKYRSCYPGDRSPRLVAYLPYYKEGHEIRVLKIKGRKETVLETIGVSSRSYLVARGDYDRDFDLHLFHEETQCHISYLNRR